jgi:hypothetical protein
VADAVDVVVGGDALVGAEGLQVLRGQLVRHDVVAGHVPAGGEARLVEHQGAGGVRDDAIAGADHEVARAVTDVNAVVGVGRVTEDAVVLLVERVHRGPRQRDLAAQDRRVVGERDVLPGAARGPARLTDDLEPGGLAELWVLGAALGGTERALGEGGDREVGHRVAARLEEHDRVVALDHGAAAELRAHPPAQRLGVQHVLGQTGQQELPVGVAAQRPLLP